jgi:hypothetical protein
MRLPTNSPGHLRLWAGVPFVLQARTCRHQETATAFRESEYGYGIGAAASSWNRPLDRRQNSEDAQIVWRLQERGRLACDQGLRAETHAKNAQVRHHRQERCAEKASEQRGEVIRVADNLEIAAMRGAKKLESKFSWVELKPNKFKKRTVLKTGRYKTQRTRQGIVSIKVLIRGAGAFRVVDRCGAGPDRR